MNGNYTRLWQVAQEALMQAVASGFITEGEEYRVVYFAKAVAPGLCGHTYILTLFNITRNGSMTLLKQPNVIRRIRFDDYTEELNMLLNDAHEGEPDKDYVAAGQPDDYTAKDYKGDDHDDA